MKKKLINRTEVSPTRLFASQSLLAQYESFSPSLAPAHAHFRAVIRSVLKDGCLRLYDALVLLRSNLDCLKAGKVVWDSLIFDPRLLRAISS